MENEAGAKMEQLTESTTQAFESYSWRDPEIVWFTARDGVKVPARLYRPQKARKNAPAVVFVHGAGYFAECTSLVEQLLSGIYVSQHPG